MIWYFSHTLLQIPYRLVEDFFTWIHSDINQISSSLFLLFSCFRHWSTAHQGAVVWLGGRKVGGGRLHIISFSSCLHIVSLSSGHFSNLKHHNMCIPLWVLWVSGWFRTVVACLVLTNTFGVIFSAKSGEDGGGLELAIQWGNFSHLGYQHRLGVE